MPALRRIRGFSALEAVVVVAILALLAGITIPRFAAARDGRITTRLLCSLSLLRAAVDDYWTQHDGYPGPDAAAFVAQLTGRTDRRGLPAAEGDIGARGPYVRDGIPDNPVSGGNSVKFVESMPHEADGTSAWIYCPASGELRANTPGEAPEGLPWFHL